MVECGRLEACPVFIEIQKTVPDMLETLKSHHCFGSYETYVCYMVLKALGTEYLPLNLFPN